MDLVAIACQEIGLDLTEEIAEFKDVQVPNQDEWRHSSLQDDGSQEAWPLTWEEGSYVKPGSEPRVVLHKQLSFGGGTSSTVFTDPNGKQSTVSLQFTEQSSYSGASPVTNLYTQRQANPNYLHRRSRPSQVAASIQGAPCRNLPELPPTSNPSKAKSRSEIHPVLEVSSLLIHPNPFQESNPFLHLFEDTRPGQTAFAFYVSDCWFSFYSSSIVPNHDQFYRQCQGWWVGLPTPYRRGYWTREVQHLQIKVKSGQLMPGNRGTMRKKPTKIIGRVVDGIEPKKVSPPKKPSPPKKMMKAFKNFLSKNRNEVEEEMVGATKREVRNELGKRWKTLVNCDKEKYIEITDEEVGDEDKENVDKQGVLTYQEQMVPNVEHDDNLNEEEFCDSYEIKVEQPPSSIYLDDFSAINAFLDAEDSTRTFSANRKEENAFQDVKTESTINMTLQEIEEFAIVAKFYVEDGTDQHSQELSSPERNVIDLVSNLSVW